MGTYGLHHDAARRVATVFEIWRCLIETDLRARRENPPKKIAPYGTFAAVSPLEYRGLKPILPFPEGRSDAACRVVIQPSRPPTMGTYGLHHDAARRVATVFEIWRCLIETDLRARRENPPKKIAPYGTFAAVSLLDYGGLNPILPFPRGRSDTACRVVVCLHDVSH